jgi:hypothetical protein
VDARLVAAIREVIDAGTGISTGNRSRLIQPAVTAVEAAHGPGVVPLPGRSTFYEPIEVLTTGRHAFGSAVTRRQTANRPRGMFTPVHAMRPGEQVQIDSTPIDVLVLLDTGVPVRADLTAVDVATGTICTAVLRPVGTKAVDAAPRGSRQAPARRRGGQHGSRAHRRQHDRRTGRRAILKPPHRRAPLALRFARRRSLLVGVADCPAQIRSICVQPIACPAQR